METCNNKIVKRLIVRGSQMSVLYSFFVFPTASVFRRGVKRYLSDLIYILSFFFFLFGFQTCWNMMVGICITLSLVVY